MNHITIEWNTEDVKAIRPCTDHQAMVTLEALKRNHDACIGINWDVIGTQFDQIYGKDTK